MGRLGTSMVTPIPVSGRARQLIDLLKLVPHPEGGHYARFGCANDSVQPADGRGTRPALSGIHFLLERGQCSRWHALRSAEVWTWIEGAPLLLQTYDPSAASTLEWRLGPAAAGVRPTQLVPGGHWQSAHSSGDYTLVSCVVGPAFDFADFRFLKDDAAALAQLGRLRSDWLRTA
jgi:uncharacterized protein